MATRICACLACLIALLVFSSPATLAGNIGLSWSGSPGASGYRLYYGPGPSNYTVTVDVGNVTQTTVSGLTDCVDSYFAVTAYNLAGESGFSPEVASWPRPSLGVGTPASAKQGTQLTLDVSGSNLQPGAAISLDNPDVLVDGNPTVSCTSIEFIVTVEPTAEGVRPAEIGSVELTVTNPNGFVIQSSVFEVLIEPARFDINRTDGTTTGRLDGKDTVWLSRLFGVQEGEATYDPNYDFDGNGWVDGEDLAYLASGFGGCWDGANWTVSACPDPL